MTSYFVKNENDTYYTYNPRGAAGCSEVSGHVRNAKSNLRNVTAKYPGIQTGSLTMCLDDLEAALHVLSKEDRYSAQQLARMTEHMMQSLEAIQNGKGIQTDNSDDNVEQMEKKKRKHIRKNMELLCKCYKKEAWKILQPQYRLHPAVKAVGIAVTALAFAVIGFAAAVAMAFIPGDLGTMMSSHVLTTVPGLSTSFLDPTVGKVIVSSVFAAMGTGLGFSLTKFFEKRCVPGNAMKKVEEVANATKKLAKEMQKAERDESGLPPRSSKMYDGL